MTPHTFTRFDDILAFVDPELRAESRHTFERWLERGDGIAVYHNVERGHPEESHRQFVSYGSDDAQLVTDEDTRGDTRYASAPHTLPDIGARINWRYHLEGTFRPAEITIARDVEVLYARYAIELLPKERATLADAAKLLRRIATNWEIRS